MSSSECSSISVWLMWCFGLCLFCGCGYCCRLLDLCWFVNLCWFDNEICGLLFVESDLLKPIDEKCSFLLHLLHVLYQLRLQSFAPQRVHCWVGGFDDEGWLCWRCFDWRSLYAFSSSPPVEWFVSSIVLVKWSAFSLVFAICVVFQVSIWFQLKIYFIILMICSL